MQEFPENILNEIRNCPTQKSLEIYKRIINRRIKDSDLRLFYIGEIGSRYFDISFFECLSDIYYPDFKLN